MFGIGAYKQRLPQPEKALPGRDTPMAFTNRHFVTGAPIAGPLPAGAKSILFGMGCFWGAERKFWTVPGVLSTAVGYAGGFTPNATYREVCSGETGHTEAVRVVYDPARVDLDTLLKTFWESHDPTQGMRQGNDTGTQYRSAIYVGDADQLEAVEASRAVYQTRLKQAGFGDITTEVAQGTPFFYAEEEHQQYLAKNPAGYCGIGGTGVTCPIGLGA
jgi:peptide-methionine (S)-S-oxide reductase